MKRLLNKSSFRLTFGLVATSTAALLWATTLPLHAQQKEQWRESEKPAEVELEGSYHGVTPGSGNNLPRVEELQNKNGSWVTWPGFLMLPNGGSRIFLQTTEAVDYKLKKKNKELQLIVKKTKIYLSNNRNPLVATYFNTPVSKARLKKAGKNAVLQITLKVGATPNISQETDSDGYHYLFIDFPPGDYPIGETTSRP